MHFSIQRLLRQQIKVEQQNPPVHLKAAITGDQLGRDTTSIAINDLFGDLAFFYRDSILQKLEVVLYSDSTEYSNVKAKLSKLHLLDGLDYLNDSNNSMKEDTRASLLREYVQELRDMLPSSYDEAWNHPDPKFKGKWRAAI